MGHIFAFITATRVKWEATAEELAEQEGDGVTAEAIRQRYSVGWHVDGRTGEITYDDDGSGDYNPASDTIRLEDPVEEGGWVDRAWNRYTLHDSRNDVRPVVDVDEDEREALVDEVKDALEWLGAYEDQGDGTFYASDSEEPFDQPWRYDYALHFVRKGGASEGYAERPWHPVNDGNIAL